MKFSLSSLAILQFVPCALARLYYPPILSPKTGDLIALGSNFTIVWNTTLPANLPPDQIANFTSEVRLGYYFPPQPPEYQYPVAYFEWHLDNLNPPPNPHPGWLQPLDFYVPTRPQYKASGVAWAEFNLGPWFCAPETDFVVGWLDSTYPQEMSGPFRIVGDCFTG